jgi:dihydropteroate synthase
MIQLVGILNVTPDSFSDGNEFLDPKKAITQAEKLFNDGASLVDVGAESTRPGAVILTADQEWQRLEPVLEELVKRFRGKLSVDTYHPETAERALNLGDVIINDVTGMNNPAMAELISRHGARCIVSQLPAANPQMAHKGVLINDQELIKKDLLAKARMLESQGLNPDRIILDPGIGFGKTPELNQKLLRFAEQIPNYRVMIGYSRKRFLGEHRMELEPNLAAGRIAIAAGAAYLRVHDVLGHSRLLHNK